MGQWGGEGGLVAREREGGEGSGGLVAIDGRLVV